MEKYHIYEEIGKGEYSQVFKGREKRKIEYVAIKRVDKSNMSKIVNEVQIMHKLQNPHILRFHDWYETKNNLWLILEYCTGADLHSLLSQDHHLPEPSIRIFAVDILSGLKYLHTSGILHCDIRPKNFLIDEYGILKFSNFKYARKIPKSPIGSEPMQSRGYPPYMAPELFLDVGVHSFASDFWSFGCLLYVLRRGIDSLPWGSFEVNDGNTVDDLIAKINAVDIFGASSDNNTTTTSMSAELVDLIGWLLERDTNNRCSWAELCAHPFWTGTTLSPPITLPTNAVFAGFIRDCQKAKADKIERDASYSELKNVVDLNTPNKQNLPSRSESSNNFGPLQYNNAYVTEGSHCRLMPSDTYQAGDLNRTTSEIVESYNAVVNDDDSNCDNLIIHNSDIQVKPIIGNKWIEAIDRPTLNGNLPFTIISQEEISQLNHSDLEQHLTMVYKSLGRSVATILPSSNSTTISASNISNGVFINISNILKYLMIISTIPEVSNIVLNTSFLTLLLKLIKTGVSNTGSSTSPSTRSSQSRRYGTPNNTTIKSPSSASAATNALVTIKILIVTILGTMLRYAAFISPPIDDNKDDHLLPVLLSQLVDDSIDIKLKRKVVAALGELLFYVTSQDEGEMPETYTGTESSKWELPSLPRVFLSCLSHADEIIQHYAAKTIENILAQGNKEYRLQILNAEIAHKLLTITMSQSSDNLKTTAAMALGLIYHHQSNIDQKIIASTLLKTSTSSICDLLADGQPRLQIALVNIINTIFKSINFNEDLQDLSSLRAIRVQFVNNPSFIDLLVRLFERSNIPFLRAKVIVTIYLICKYSPILFVKLGGSRFASTWSRILESSSSNGYYTPSGDNNAAATYLHDVSMATISLLQSSSILLINQLSHIDRREDQLNNYLDTALRLPMSDLSNILSSVVSIVSQATIRRLFFTAKIIPFFVGLVKVMGVVEHESKLSSRVTTSIKDVEHSMLLCLESVCMIDFEERIENARNSKDQLDREQDLLKFMITVLFPRLVQSVTNPSPDIRVVVVSCVRSILPTLVRALLMIQETFGEVNIPSDWMFSLIDRLFEVVPALLKDFQPIPQYTIKLLNDLNSIASNAEMIALKDLMQNHVRRIPIDLIEMIQSN